MCRHKNLTGANCERELLSGLGISYASIINYVLQIAQKPSFKSKSEPVMSVIHFPNAEHHALRAISCHLFLIETLHGDPKSGPPQQ